MRIRSLRFRNLASLAGEWELDFTHPAFAAHGLFAITGPTGAGKSTVLDAICLALYGRTPRLGKVEARANEIISRGCRDCFAEVRFETPDGLFASTWTYTAKGQQATEGKIEVTLRRLDTDADLTPDDASKKTTKTRTLAEVESLTGLDFTRFTRSVLLAQGDFAAFLKAGVKDRAVLLERITGTDLYATLSTLTYERHAAEEKRLAELSAELRGLALLADEERAALTERLTRCSAEETALGATLETLRSARNWLEKREALAAEQQALPQTRQALDQQQAAFAPQAARLRLAKAALELEAPHAALSTRRAGLLAAQESHRRLQVQTPVAEQQAAEAARTEQTARTGLAALEAEARLADPLHTRVRALDVRIRERRQHAADTERTVRTLSAGLEHLRRELAAEHTALTTAQTERNAVQARLEATAAQAGLSGLLSGFRADVGAIAACRTRLAELTTARTAIAARSLAATRAIAEAETALRDRQKTLLPAETQLKTRQDERSRLLDGQDAACWREQEQTLLQHGQQLAEVKNQLAALHAARTAQQGHAAALTALGPTLTELDTLQRVDEALIPQLEARRVLLERVRTLEGHRTRLEPGQPCPLCGSEHHPYATATPPPPDETQQELRTIQLRLRQTLENSTRLKTEQATLLARLEQARADEATSRARLEALLPELPASLPGLPDSNASQPSLLSLAGGVAEALRSHAVSSGVPADPADPADPMKQLLPHVDSALDAVRTRYLAARTVTTRLNELETALQTLQTTVDAARLAVQTAERTLHDARTTGSEVEREAQRLHAEHATLTAQHDRAVAALREAVTASVPAAGAETDAFFARYGTGEAEALAALLDHLTALARSRSEAEARFAALGATLAGLTAGLAQREKAVQAETLRLETEQAQLGQRQNEVRALEAERRDLFADRDPDAEAAALATRQAAARAALEAAVAARETAARALAEHGAALTAAAQAITSQQTEVDEALAVFVAQLATTPFADEAALLAARLPEAQRLPLEAAEAALTADRARLDERAAALQLGLQRLEQERTASAALRDCLELAETMELDETAEAQRPSTSLSRLQRRVADLEAQRQALNREAGGLSMRLAEDDALRTARSERMGAVTAQREQTDRWARLKDLIGSKEGALYRNFAQSLTFAALMEQANTQLRGMTDRYTLVPSPENPLCLCVVDHYQAGEVRPSANLSGGETFLVSLALALGLSDMVSRRSGVDSLFLDEGFGTLDPDALDMALETLASLRRGGKLICVISHVPALQERMALHVEVHAGPGGRSELAGPGVRSVPLQAKVRSVPLPEKARSVPLSSKVRSEQSPSGRKRKSKAAPTPSAPDTQAASSPDPQTDGRPDSLPDTSAAPSPDTSPDTSTVASPDTSTAVSPDTSTPTTAEVIV